MKIFFNYFFPAAAHCIVDRNNQNDYKNYFTLLGRHNLTDDSERNFINQTILDIFAHPDYDSSARAFKSRNDIAIFKMSQSIEFTDFIQPICLPQMNEVIPKFEGFIVGHGWNENKRIESVAKQAKMKYKNFTKCIFEHPDNHKGVYEFSFCASNETAMTCNGDSGSGFYIKNNRRRFVIYGILSQGLTNGNCEPNDTAVFVDVTKYVRWIEESKI